MPDGALSTSPPVTEILEEIVVAELVESWRRDLRVDVSRAFEGVSALRLCRDSRTGRIFFDPPIAGTGAFYDRLHAFDWYRPASKAEHRLAAGLIGRGQRVLDVGAGDGAFGDRLQDADYTGLEFGPQRVATALSRGRRLLGLRLADLAEQVTDGRREGYGFVTAFQVLEHLDDPDAFVAAARRCLIPQGRLILGVPDRESYVAQLPDFVLNAPPHHLTWWDPRALGELLRQHGLRYPTYYRFPVESWERRLWWMARTARALGGAGRRRFGGSLRALKCFSWLAAGLLQAIEPPNDARGATLVVMARR